MSDLNSKVFETNQSLFTRSSMLMPNLNPVNVNQTKVSHHSKCIPTNMNHPTKQNTFDIKMQSSGLNPSYKQGNLYGSLSHSNFLKPKSFRSLASSQSQRNFASRVPQQTMSMMSSSKIGREQQMIPTVQTFNTMKIQDQYFGYKSTQPS